MPQKLSLWETVDALLGWISVVAAVIYAAISGPFRGRSGADTYHHHIIQAATKKVLYYQWGQIQIADLAQLTTRFSPLQLQYLFKSYDQIYLDYCQKNGIQPHFVSTDRGVKGFWIGNPSAKYIIINFHGGGFAMDATEPYLDFWPDIQNALADAGIETAWLYSTYTLTPNKAYPFQFVEAVETLRYVLEDLGRSPREVLIAGDSAGASLCLAILSHLKYRSVDVPELTVEEPLKGAILLSPWVSHSHEWPSMKLNKHKDIDSVEVTERWSKLYLDGQPSNYYVEAVTAPQEWWNGIQVEQTLVLAGTDEVLLDPIRTWASKFKKSHPGTSLILGKNECHVAPLIWPMFGDYHETEQGRALKYWLLQRLS